MYQKSIVTFMDVLGFREIVKDKPADAILNILNIFNELAVSENNEPDFQTEPTCLSFSDSIIRVRNLHSETNMAFPIGHLFHEVNSLVHIHVDLIEKGIFIRGGISIGDVYVSSDKIFGPAFVGAYDLESKFANYPRIIVSPELINSIGKDHLVISENHTPDEEKEYLKTQLYQGDDGLWFVDYLRASRLEFDDVDYYPKFLKKHKNLIIDQGGSHSTLSSVSSKYIWLSNYHNKVISELPDSFFKYYKIKRNNLIVSEREIEALSEL